MLSFLGSFLYCSFQGTALDQLLNHLLNCFEELFKEPFSKYGNSCSKVRGVSQRRQSKRTGAMATPSNLNEGMLSH